MLFSHALPLVALGIQAHIRRRNILTKKVSESVTKLCSKVKRFVSGLPESLVTGETGRPHVVGMLFLCRRGAQRKEKQNCHLTHMRKVYLQATFASLLKQWFRSRSGPGRAPVSRPVQCSTSNLLTKEDMGVPQTKQTTVMGAP